MTSQRQIAADISRLSAIYTDLTRPYAVIKGEGMVILDEKRIAWACEQLQDVIANLVDLIPEQPAKVEEVE